MKISELTTDRGVDVLVQITPHVSSIATNAHLADELKKIAEVPANTLKSKFQELVFGADVFSRLIPILLKENREDFYAILAIINEKNVEDIASQNIIETISMIRELFSDKTLINFFKSFVDTPPKK